MGVTHMTRLARRGAVSSAQEGADQHEEAPDVEIEPQAEASARIPSTHEHARRTTHARPSTTQRALAAHPRVTRSTRIGTSTPPSTRLKFTEAFRAVYRRGRWAHGRALSVGILANQCATARVGLRTRKGLKGAVERNRFKRQLRAIVNEQRISLRPGLDIIIVIHPRTIPTPTKDLERELLELCRRTNVLS